MNGNIINNLTLLINDNKFEDNSIYRTIAIKFGFAVSKMYLQDENKFIDVNSANGNLFANYIKLYLKKKFRIYVKTTVVNNMMYINLKCKKENFDDSLEKVIKSIYLCDVNEKLLEEAKEITTNNFKENYEKDEFKAYYKLMEFALVHKNFNMLKMVKDIEKLNIESFKNFIENVVTFDNSILYINGDIEYLKDSNIAVLIRDLKVNHKICVPAADKIDDYLTDDRHFIMEAASKVKNGCINITFFNDTLAMLDRQFLLSIINTSLFGVNGQVILDEFDSTIIYFGVDHKTYKDKILDLFTEDIVEKAKNYILSSISALLDIKPYEFNQIAIEYYSKGIDMLQYLKAVELCSADDIKEIFEKGDIKIVEGQVLFLEKV